MPHCAKRCAPSKPRDFIRRRQGSGTFVVGKFQVIDAGLEVLESLETMARRMNLEITVSDLNIEQIDADEEHCRRSVCGGWNALCHASDA